MEHLQLAGSLKLVDDVLLIPLAELPAESRARLEGSDDDVAVSRLQSRSGSKIIDASAASLLARFREPRTVVDAVILFSREHRLDPDEVLEGAFPLLRSLVDGGFLAPAGRSAAEEAPGAPRWRPGAELLGGRVERTLQQLDDTEVALLARGERRSVLKLARRGLDEPQGAASARQLRHEARFLEHLGGDLAPALLGEGEIDGHAYLEIEHLVGVEVGVAAAEWRERGLPGRGPLLALLHAIVEVYAELHRRGVAHGDVHPRNLLVDRAQRVRPIDFGVARALDVASALPAPGGRGGVPFFYEPELARAALDGVAPPPASAAGEQFAVGALLYCLATGTHRRDFSLARERMLSEIVETAPLPFRERGTDAWPELEAVLGRALARRPEERFASVAELSKALSKVSSPGRTPSAGPTPTRSALDRHLAEAIASAGLDGPWLAQGLRPAPTVSVNYGAAGLAVGLRQIAERHDDARVLAAADVWARRAARGLDHEDAFYNAEIQITREVVGERSLYHSPSGVHAAAALVARALGDPVAQGAAVERFLVAAERPAAGLDLTLGRTSTLLGAAILLDSLPESAGGVGVAGGAGLDDAPLRRFGERELTALWAELDGMPAMARADLEYLGIAHGWAGFLYGTLLWCEIAGTPIPAGVERRLDELATFARSAGRGLQWPWVLRPGAETTAMPGWCSGSCGYLFLWTAAHRRFGRSRDLDLAIGAAWDAWDAPESPITLCCGLAGRAYALLNLYRHTHETVWLERARDLALRAARTEKPPADYPHSLYKGAFGLAVLAADVERPEESAMPLFEPAGFRAARRARRAPA